VQRRGITFLWSVVWLAFGDTSGRESNAILHGTVPNEQVAEYETGQQAGHAHRATCYHLGFG